MRIPPAASAKILSGFFDRSDSVLLGPQFLEQERPGVSPNAIGSSLRNTERSRRLGSGQAGKEPQLHEFGGMRVAGCKPVERLVQCEQIDLVIRNGRLYSRQLDAADLSARFRLPLRRAWSMRIRRIASAAAAKKWPREEK